MQRTVLYMTNFSPPVRSVLLTCKALGIEVEQKVMNFFKGEHLSPEFVKINPQHTVPTLVDDGQVLWDSHAINPYLVSKYGKDDSLYPKDLVKRAIVDQRLHFDSGMIFPIMRTTIKGLRDKKFKTMPQYNVEATKEVYGLIENFLENKPWVAGDDLTIADFTLISSVTSLSMMVPFDETEHKNLIAWVKRAKELPYYESHNHEEHLREFIKVLTK